MRKDLVQATAEPDPPQNGQLHAAPTAIKEGAELFFVPKSIHQPRKRVTVTKVGRKWLTLSNGYRADKVTLDVESGYNTTIARLYLSEEHYHAKLALDDLWREFRTMLQRNWSVPEGLTVKEIRHVAWLLKIELPS